MAFKILSCDGGGIRGLITALLIRDLNRRFGFIAKADAFAGTSTGGLIALALADGLPVDSVIDLYRNQGGTIFEPNEWFASDADGREQALSRAIGELGTGPGFRSSQYTNAGLKRLAGKLFGSRRLSDLNRLVVVNSARLWKEQSWVPASFSNAPANPYRDLPLADAALATSAAPTYFPPYEISAYGYFADGGTFANNPAMTALAEALGGRYASGVDDVHVLSLGTGQAPEGIRPAAVSDPLKWGVTHWLWPLADDGVPAMALLNLTLDLTAAEATAQAARILGSQFRRGNFVLPEPFGLDDWQHVAKLEQWTEHYLATSADWARICDWVEAEWQ